MLQNVDPKVKCVTLFPSLFYAFFIFLDFWVFTFYTELKIREKSLITEFLWFSE